MDKSRTCQENEIPGSLLKRKSKDSLEISSTGYGYVSEMQNHIQRNNQKK